MTTPNIPEQLLPQLLERFKDEIVTNASQPCLQTCKKSGSEIWLDTGDMEAIDRLITPEVSAVTTNNTLLNMEVQKGIYDGIIKEVSPRFKALPLERRIIEIAFLLNALHGLRLVKRYGGKVSVELHTDFADDMDGIVFYGQRFHAIDPDHFIVKVPLTPSGLLGARKLHDLGIPVNFTLMFSARQNVMAALLARPSYSNVFLGRIGGYMKQNYLGDAEGPGEKTVHHTQHYLRSLREDAGTPTHLIAASIRDYKQLPLLCGVDVLTIPPKVVADAFEKIEGPCHPMNDHDFNVIYRPGVATSEIRINKLWEVSDHEKKVFTQLSQEMPNDAWELEDHLRAAGIPDLFPDLTPVEELYISEDGKIPKHQRWARAISRGEIAIDTLLNLAGLAAFAKDQKALDDRIAKLI
ncbi:transaldolase family protein [Thermophagus sp. OGC60D27]|uniref:transaldolase family protein n=1 Tax=Thermophagus sp. OGC60D27 TaxID=3458415 RepID=UPI004037FB33